MASRGLAGLEQAEVNKQMDIHGPNDGWQSNEATRHATPEKTSEHVDPSAAAHDFEAVRQELKRQSSINRTITTSDKDLEKASDDDFDLLEYLQTAANQDRETGFRSKSLGLVFEDLNVVGAGGIKLNIRTFPDAFKELLLSPFMPILMKKFGPKPKSLLHSFNGVVKPNEMLLVLGRPGAGCSTFLRAAANQRKTFLEVNGKVEYGGFEATEFRKQYRGEVAYNQEDDDHIATLTVGQTIDFALSTKTPGTRLGNTTTKTFRKQVADLLMKMFNISHTKDTLVGGFDVRGVSGGERKRVSLIEMLAASPAVAMWDQSSRGLDASTALDYAKCLRILTDVFSITNVASLYQAGEGMYEQFDKVLVIDQGHQIFFGKTSEARQYFLDLGFADLPRQTTADYLTGCTDPNQRRFASGRDASNVPSTPEQLEEAFRKSRFWDEMIREREDYRNSISPQHQEKYKAAVQDTKRKLVSKQSPYTVSFPTQVWSIAKRAALLKYQDTLGITTMYASSIIIAIIIGTVFFELPQTSSGAFTRGGVIFLGLLFPAFTAFSELPHQMMGRPLLHRQVGFSFFRPAAFTLGASLADIPFALLNIFVFTVILYFMTGLFRSAGAYFTFYLFVFLGYGVLSAFFRLIGVFCSSFDVAARLAALIISFFILYSGYLIPPSAQKRWLFWIGYINPVNYGFAALMINEFKRLSMSCEGGSVVPNGPGFSNVVSPTQVCTLPGSVSGQQFVSGAAYINTAFSYNVDDLWRNLWILILFWVGFLVMQVFAIEFHLKGQASLDISVFAKENKELKKLNRALADDKEAFRKGEKTQNVESLIQSKKALTFENLCYDVPVHGGQKRLLDNVFGYVKPGTLTALMGASGAGKTTLLDVLAQRKNIGVINGNVLIGSQPLTKSFARGTAYAEQQDVHEPYSTVREALRFSARLRQPAHVSIEEKDKYVEEIIQLLELEDLADAMVGFPGFGLSVEARKRVTIGVELASKPQLLLFLDEPTSGLDGNSATNLVRFLRKLADAGQAILCTIHQPNALLFEYFDKLLLLQRGGQTVYFGDISTDSQTLRDYFARHGAHCPPTANPAEFMLEAIGAGSSKRVGNKDWHQVWLESEEFAETKREIKRIVESRQETRDTSDEHVQDDMVYATPFLTQFKTVVARTTKTAWRSPDYMFTRLFNHAIIALVTGITFVNLGTSTVDLQYRVFCIFIATILPALILAQIEPAYIMARTTFNREASSKMYSPVVFAGAQLCGELPYSVLCALVFFICIYYPPGFQGSSSRAGFYFFVLLIVEIYSVTLGQAVAALSPSIFIAATINPFLLVLFSVLCGVTVPYVNLPKFWRSWAYWVDPFSYMVSALTSNELEGLTITCKPEQFYTFNPPNGQSCAAYAQAFVDTAGGYLDNASDSTACRYCTYRTGSDFFPPLNINFDDRWRNVGILIAFLAFNIVVTIVAARYLRYSKR